MPERRSKHELESRVELNAEELGFVLEPTQIEVGSGYTISVDYDENEKPIIDLKTYGEVDISKIEREIKRVFPNAQIRQLNQTKSVTIVKKRRRRRPIKKK